MLLIVLALVMGATPVQAAAKSTVMKKADAATKDVTNTANYYGWEVMTAKVTKKTSNSVTKKLRIEKSGSKTYFAYTQVTKKSGKKYSTTFKLGKVRYLTSEVKSGLRSYSDSKAVKSFLKNRADKKTSSLEKYAKARGWKTVTKVKSTTKKATATVNFTGGTKTTKATITVTRNKKGPKVAYKLSGKKSSEKAIKNWLEQNKNKTGGSSSEQVVVTDDELKKLASSKTAELVTLGKRYHWKVTTMSGAGTVNIKTLFKNSKYNFTVVVKAAVKNGKAAVSYELMGSEVDRAYIESWITEYAIADDPTIIVSQEELVKFAAAETSELMAMATAKNWEAKITSGQGTTKVSSHYENSKWQFDVTVEAIDGGNGKAIAVYSLEGDKDTKERIISWINEFAMGGDDSEDPDDPEEPEDPGAPEVTEKFLIALASSEVASLTETANELGWTVSVTDGAGTKEISLMFENSKWSFPAKVEAIKEQNETKAKLYIKGKIVTKEYFVQYLKKYQVNEEPGEPDDKPDQPDKPDDNPDQPDKPTTPSDPDPDQPDDKPEPTAEDLQKAAEKAWGELHDLATSKKWNSSASVITDDKTSTVNAIVAKGNKSFGIKVEARNVAKEIMVFYYVISNNIEALSTDSEIIEMLTVEDKPITPPDPDEPGNGDGSGDGDNNGDNNGGSDNDSPNGPVQRPDDEGFQPSKPRPID